jgi:hypothetical protein
MNPGGQSAAQAHARLAQLNTGILIAFSCLFLVLSGELSLQSLVLQASGHENGRVLSS